jgi:hypothetical protein
MGECYRLNVSHPKILVEALAPEVTAFGNSTFRKYLRLNEAIKMSP